MEEALKHLPKPWSYSGTSDRNLSVSVSKYDAVDLAGVIALLYEWAKKYKLGLEPYGTTYYSDNREDYDIWNTFKVSNDFALTEKFFGDGTSETTDGSVPNGKAFCRSCYKRGLRVVLANTFGQKKLQVCILCITPCNTCNAPMWAAEFSAKTPSEEYVCAECRPVFKCGLCTRWVQKNTGEQTIDICNRNKAVWKKEQVVCASCIDNRRCQKCGRHFERNTKFVDYEGEKLCPNCHEETVLKDFEKHEKFRIEELPKGGLTIKSLPARPYRTISIETEMDGDKRVLASTLFKCGIVRVPEVERYGTQTPDQSHWPAFLKHDGSVTGGELISFMLSLDKKEHSEAFKTTLRKLRALEKSKFIEFNPNCGGHIHIDAHGFGTENIWRLLTLWNYLEDFTYRLAGAGSPYGHRSLVPGHAVANGGHGYANPTVKGPWGIKSAVGTSVRQQDRMCGLNFQPYIYSTGSCACGAARADNMRACTCALPKCTIEWRVWNSQRSPRILHAWIAYMQAVHGFADVDEEPDAAFEKRFPVLGWTRREWKALSASQKKQVYERIDWCFNNLVLTSEERDSLVYAITKTDIEVTPSLERQWLSINGPSLTVPVKRKVRATPYNHRKGQIIIKSPNPGDEVPLAQTAARQAAIRFQPAPPVGGRRRRRMPW